MAEAAAATAGGGNLESAGVVLAAIDQFSSNIQKYVEDLRRVQASNQKLTDEEQRAAAAATKTTGAWKLSGEQASKYGLAAGVLSGQMRQLGIQNEVAARGISIAAEAMSGSLGAIGGMILGLGALASATAAVVTHTKHLHDETKSLTQKLADQASKTGIMNDAERELLAIRKTQIQLEIKHAEAILEKTRVMGMELNLWERLTIETLKANHQYAAAANLAAQWTVASNQAATAEQLDRLRQLKDELEKINLAFDGGTDAIQRRKQAADEAARKEKEAAEEAKRTALEAAQYRASTHQVRLQEAEQWLDAMAEEMSVEKRRADQAKRFFEEQKKQQEEQRRRDEAAAKSREDAYARWVAIATQAAQSIGAAIGAAAAGSTSSWRSAGIAMIQMAAHAAASFLAIWGTAQAAIGNIAGAARAAAGAAAIEALAAAGVAYLQERESRRHQGSQLHDGAPTRRSGPSIGVESGSTVANVSLTQNISGNISPENAGDWRQQGQAFLDAHMDRWISRRRAQGYRFA